MLTKYLEGQVKKSDLGDMIVRVFFVSLLVIASYYFSVTLHYLLFHSLAELFSIVIACCVFVISWSSKETTDNPNWVYLGTSYLFISILDILHTLSYQGMTIVDTSFFPANQLWIAARGMEAISLLLFLPPWEIPLLKRRFRTVFTAYSIITAIIILSIFNWRCFPVCFDALAGQTTFKLFGEYSIILILVVTSLVVAVKKKFYSPIVFKYLEGSLLLTILSELSFTFYISNYGFSNFVGHLFKILSFYLIYKAIVETGLKHAYEILYRRLKSSERLLNETQRMTSTAGWQLLPDQHTLTCTKEFYGIFDMAPGTIQRLEDFFPLLPVGSVENIKRKFKSLIEFGDSFEIEFKIETSHGVKWIRMTGIDTRHQNDETFLTGTVQDISESKKLEILKKDVERITQHDMKTPLSSVLSALDHILQTNDNLDSDQQELLNHAYGSANTLYMMLETSQTLYQLELGIYKVKFDKIDIPALLPSILRELKGLMKIFKVSCVSFLDNRKTAPKDHFYIEGEETLVYALLENLIKNAIEASPENAQVIIQLHNAGDMKIIKVMNSGAVPTEFRDHFFDKYATHGKDNGTGIGTYSAKMITEALNGNISMETSEIDNQTILTLMFPRSEQSPE